MIGCGKSATLRVVAGLEEISDGELYIDGKLMNDAVPKNRDIIVHVQSSESRAAAKRDSLPALKHIA